MAARTRQLRRAVSEAEKEIRRETILGAAKRVFSQSGYAATTISDIAREAGVSYGTIYWYFDSKEELFDALMDAGERALRSHILEALTDAGPSDIVAALETSVRATFEYFDADRDATRLLFRDSYVMGGRFEKHLVGIYERFIDDLEATIAAGQRDGVFRDLPTRVVAFSLGALVGQLAYRRLTTDDGVTPEELADAAITLVMDGLRSA